MQYLNQIAFDRDTKDYVLITNGKCTLDHSNPEAFQLAHKANNGSCHYEPSEAIAIRIIGMHNNRPVVGWTYVSVRLQSLSCSTPMQSLKPMFDCIIGGKRTRYSVGRI
jgi:hypothetical protein